MQPPLVFGPIPPYNNPAIAPQNFKPSQFTISGINLGPTTTITTATNHNYTIGQLVRLLIPNGYGSRQLNEQTGYVLSIPLANQATLSISSQTADPFISARLKNTPQIVAVGDINQGQISSTGRNIPSVSIPGSFLNISS